jgi:cytochrome P450
MPESPSRPDLDGPDAPGAAAGGPDGGPAVAIDHHAPEFLADRHRRYADLQRQCPVAWNTSYGGYWLVTGYEPVAAVARDADTFSHRFDLDAGDGLAYRGICGVPRPKGVPRQGVSEIDGAAHADLRRLLNPFFTPRRVADLRPRAESLAAEFVDAFVDRGRADLVHDYATPVPAILTLEMMGMPSDNWRHYADFFHASTSYAKGSPELLAAQSKWQDMMAELVGFAVHRRRHPADDITTALVQGRLDGAELGDAQVGDIMWNLVAGGIDTTTSLTGWALHHLGTHPADRERVRADRSLLPFAIEEFLRHFSPNETLTRTATRDVELAGRQIRRGDVVMVSWVAANHDPDAFDDPDEVRIDRPANKHLAFGAGRHRCIGAHLARMETEVLLGEVLDRIPDYRIDADAFRPSPGNVLMTSVVSMPVTFTPGGSGRGTDAG